MNDTPSQTTDTPIDALGKCVADLEALWAVKEAFRFYVDAADDELRDAGLTREQALSKARDMDMALPDHLRDDGTGRWARATFPGLQL